MIEIVVNLQAYTTELESLVKHLEIENKQLEEEQVRLYWLLLLVMHLLMCCVFS